jgi:hypothetical protein
VNLQLLLMEILWKIEIIIINKPSILFIDSSGSLIFKDLRKTCIW